MTNLFYEKVQKKDISTKIYNYPRNLLTFNVCMVAQF